MKYRLVAFDFDGTFLDSEGNIPKRNADALKRLKKLGVELLAVTGRNDILVKDYIEELGIDIPVVGCNGASLGNVITGERSYIHPIGKDVVKKVIYECIRLGIPCKAMSIDACYTSDNEMLTKGIKQIVAKYTRELKYMIDYIYFTDEQMLELAENTDIVKLVTVNDDIEKLMALQGVLRGISGIQVLKSNRNCLDMIAENVSKGNALKKYASDMGIRAEGCIAFGDNENDISMLKYAGLGVAMANADECVRAAADEVTLTNDECGVAAVLEREFNI